MPFDMAYLDRALSLRTQLCQEWAHENTNCYRVFHGATEGVPGLNIDRYGTQLLVQTWRTELFNEADLGPLTEVVSHWCGSKLVGVWNRRDRRGQVELGNQIQLDAQATGFEAGLAYDVRVRHKGIDPLLFLDFRAARRWVAAKSAGKSVLNLFSYTCGIGISALSGGARSVLNVDFAERSLSVGLHNAKLNQLKLANFHCLHQDVFPVIRQLSGLGVKGRAARRPFKKLKPQKFDLVVLDPPRMAKSPFGKVDLVNDYASLFKPVVHIVDEGGCALVTNNVASVHEASWHTQLERCAIKAGRPFERLIPLRPEPDFPSPDQNWPLKMAIVYWS